MWLRFDFSLRFMGIGGWVIEKFIIEIGLKLDFKN